MRKILYFIVLIAILLSSCQDKGEDMILSTYPDGTPLKAGTFKWKGNKQVMIYEYYYFPNGDIEIEGGLNYKGQKHGKWIYWKEGGKKWIEENYTNGIRDGKFIEWYLSGDKSFEGEYDMGIPGGTWIFYDDEGNKTTKMVYEDGVVVKEKSY